MKNKIVKKNPSNQKSYQVKRSLWSFLLRKAYRVLATLRWIRSGSTVPHRNSLQTGFRRPSTRSSKTAKRPAQPSDLVRLKKKEKEKEPCKDRRLIKTTIYARFKLNRPLSNGSSLSLETTSGWWQSASGSLEDRRRIQPGKIEQLLPEKEWIGKRRG